MNASTIVVTGMGVVSPIGNNTSQVWESLRNGHSAAGPITRFDASHFSTRIAAEIRDFNPQHLDSAKQLRKMDRLTWYALEACDQAMQQSGLRETIAFPKSRIGVSWASGNGGMESIDQALLDYASQLERPRFSPYFQSKALPDAASGWIAARYGLEGPNQLSVAACASSNAAFFTAMMYLQCGYADVMVAGGSEAAITPSVIGGFGAMKALSTEWENPSKASRPFAADRDGFLLGEGAGALILERYDHAVRRGAPILAILSGCGNANDAGHPTAAREDGAGTAASVRMALNAAQLEPHQIDLINPHATSTPNGDLAEYEGMYSVFGEVLKTLPMAATKAQSGHLLGAAGAVEAVFSILSIQHQMLPGGSASYAIDEAIAARGIALCSTPESARVQHVLSHSAGFGGHNATVIFSRP